MSFETSPPPDAESSPSHATDADASPRNAEPRLLTRAHGYSAEPTLEKHRLHDVEQALDAEPHSRRNGLRTAVAQLRRRQVHHEQQTTREAGAGRKWLLFTLALLFAFALFFVGTGLYLRHAMHASLPQLDGTLRVTGLGAPVEVVRNPQGVPVITARSLDDLLFAQGFVTAQDRLWQMDALRRNASGELAEILGSRLLEHDRRQRYLQVRAAAERAVAALAPEQLAQLEAYARGVNAEIAEAGSNLPIEFRVLHYTPAPWTPRDSILLSLSMAQDLGTSFPQKMNREALAAHLPPALLNDVYPVGSWRDHPPTQPPLDLTAPRDVPEIPLDETQTGFSSLDPKHAPHMLPQTNTSDLLAISAALRPCSECIAGSNNWAVAGSRSASGKPLLSNDMHLSLSAPDIWYEASLHLAPEVSPSSAALDVTGFTLPGVPFVIVGRNAHVAWGFTNLGGDVQDVRVEHLRGTGTSIEYQRADGTWAAAGHHAERIRTRGGRDVLLDVLTTTAPLGSSSIETPIISPLYPSERRALSLAWTVYDPAVLSSPFLGANQAADGPALVAALASFGAPSLNLVWADDAGHIGYHALGRIPVRGPAVHHPRAAEELVLPDRVPAEDQKDEEQGRPDPGDSGERALAPALWTNSSEAPWQLAAFRPRRRQADRTPQRAAARTGLRPERRAAVRPHQRVATAPPPVKAAEPVIAAAPAALDYTVGSSLPAVPVDALDPSGLWSGYVPFADLPAAQDPTGGVLATANSRVTADDYPYALTLSWIDPYRTERIYKRLGASARKLTAADMLALQNDVHSELDLAVAHRVAYAIDHSSDSALGADKTRLRQAADLMRGWQGEMLAKDATPAIVASLRAELLPMLLAGQIAAHDHLPLNAPAAQALASLYLWGSSGTALEALLLHQPRAWLPPGTASWNDLLAAAAEHALVRAEAPRDLSRWSYGSQHTIEISHPVLSTVPLLSTLLGVSGSSGRFAADGDASTIKAIGRQHGPSERFTADLGIAGEAIGNITTGQSGNPASPWFMDQFPSWLRGTSFALPFRAERAAHTLTLTP